MSKIPGLTKSQSVTKDKSTTDTSLLDESKDESSMLSRKSSIAKPKVFKAPTTVSASSGKEETKQAAKEDAKDKVRPATAKIADKKEAESKLNPRPATAKPAA
jgi:hypothetical protein